MHVLDARKQMQHVRQAVQTCLRHNETLKQDIWQAVGTISNNVRPT
jgi:hypothetical protein